MLNKPKYIIVHRTGGTNANPLADTSNHTWEIINAWHLKLGWEGFGYHYLIEKDGKTRKGRPENYHGAHCKTHNTDSIGICIAGNFDATLPTKEQEIALEVLLKDITKRHNILISNIVPHRAFTNKTCYGRRLSEDWARNLLKNSINKEKLYTLLEALRKEIDLL